VTNFCMSEPAPVQRKSVQESRVQMFMEDDVSASSCTFFHTHQPPEDPSVSCWLVDQEELDSLEYVCTLDHPCLDMDRDDHQDHTEDSY